MALIIPNTIANGQTADGDALAANFAAIASWAGTDVAEKTFVTAQKPVSMFERTTDIALSTTSQQTGTVTFESETNDVDGWWSSGVNLVCPATGLYAMSIEFDLNKTCRGTFYDVSAFLQAGSDHRTFPEGGHLGYTDETAFRYSAGDILHLRSGQTFQLAYMFSSFNGSSQSITIENARVIICRLGLI